MIERHRAFLESNVLFFATFAAPNDFEAFWFLPDVLILTSEYSIGEVNQNFKTAEQRSRLWRLVERSEVVPAAGHIKLSEAFILPAKDVPMLQSAIAGNAAFLITGDVNHFGPYYNTVVEGVLIESPAVFKARYPEHFRRGVSR